MAGFRPSCRATQTAQSRPSRNFWRRAAPSPWQSLPFFAARARSAKNAASAYFVTPRGGGDRCQSFTAQRGFLGQLTGCGQSGPKSA